MMQTKKIPLKGLLISGGMAAIGLLLFFLLLFQGYLPINNDIEMTENELQTEQKMLSLVEKKKQNQLHEKETGELEKRLPITENVDQLIIDLTAAEEATGVKMVEMNFLTDINPSEAETGDASSNQVGQIWLEGKVEATSEQEVDQFLERIEAFSRITQIEKINYSHSSESELTVDISLATYYLVEQK